MHSCIDVVCNYVEINRYSFNGQKPGRRPGEIQHVLMVLCKALLPP